MTEVNSIKTQCRTLKARVTSASNHLRAIVRTDNESLINSAFDALRKLYEQFCVADLEYCELIELLCWDETVVFESTDFISE